MGVCVGMLKILFMHNTQKLLQDQKTRLNPFDADLIKKL